MVYHICITIVYTVTYSCIIYNTTISNSISILKYNYMYVTLCQSIMYTIYIDE